MKKLTDVCLFMYASYEQLKLSIFLGQKTFYIKTYLMSLFTYHSTVLISQFKHFIAFIILQCIDYERIQMPYHCNKGNFGLLDNNQNLKIPGLFIILLIHTGQNLLCTYTIVQTLLFSKSKQCTLLKKSITVSVSSSFLSYVCSDSMTKRLNHYKQKKKFRWRRS